MKSHSGSNLQHSGHMAKKHYLTYFFITLLFINRFLRFERLGTGLKGSKIDLDWFQDDTRPLRFQENRVKRRENVEKFQFRCKFCYPKSKVFNFEMAPNFFRIFGRDWGHQSWKNCDIFQPQTAQTPWKWPFLAENWYVFKLRGACAVWNFNFGYWNFAYITFSIQGTRKRLGAISKKCDPKYGTR